MFAKKPLCTTRKYPNFFNKNFLFLCTFSLYGTVVCYNYVNENLNTYNTRKDIHKYSTRKNYILNILAAILEKTMRIHKCMKKALFNKLPKEP